MEIMELNLKIGEELTLQMLDSEIMDCDYLIEGEQGITDYKIALENKSWCYSLADEQEQWLDIGFTQISEYKGYQTLIKIDYIEII